METVSRSKIMIAVVAVIIVVTLVVIIIMILKKKDVAQTQDIVEEIPLDPFRFQSNETLKRNDPPEPKQKTNPIGKIGYIISGTLLIALLSFTVYFFERKKQRAKQVQNIINAGLQIPDVDPSNKKFQNVLGKISQVNKKPKISFWDRKKTEQPINLKNIKLNKL